MALWTPNNLAVKPRKWADLQNTAGIVQAAGTISQVANLGTEAGAFTQTTAGYQPGYNASGLAAGYPAAMFTGGQVLDAPMALTVATASCFAVGAFTSGTDSGRRLMSISQHDVDYPDARFAAAIKSSSNTPRSLAIERAGTNVTGVKTIASPCIMLSQFDGTNASVFNNTVFESSAADARVFGTTYMTIGAWYQFGTNPIDTWTGPISEWLLLDYVLNATDLQKMEGYLAWRWGLQTGTGGVLASSHPYYSAAPTDGAAVVTGRRRSLMVISS